MERRLQPVGSIALSTARLRKPTPIVITRPTKRISAHAISSSQAIEEGGQEGSLRGAGPLDDLEKMMRQTRADQSLHDEACQQGQQLSAVPSSSSRSSGARGQREGKQRAPGTIDITWSIKGCKTWRQLRRVVDAHVGSFNHINAAAALVHLAKLGPAPQRPPPDSSSRKDAMDWDEYAGFEALLQQLLQLCSKSIQQFGPRQVANVMWACAQLSSSYQSGHPMCLKLLDLLMQPSQTLMPWSNSIELSSSLWAVATTYDGSEPRTPSNGWLDAFLLAFESATGRGEARPRHLSTILWGLARLGVAPDEEWQQLVFAEAQRQLPGFSPRDAAQMLAACAALGLDLGTSFPTLLVGLRDGLLQGLERQLDGQRGNAASGDAGTSAADGSYQAQPASSELPLATTSSSAEAGGDGSEGGGLPHSLSSGLWALATMRAVPPASWMARAISLLEASISHFSPQSLSTVMWAAATMGQPVPARLMRAIYAATLHQPVHHHVPAHLVPPNPQRLDYWPPQSLANFIWAVSVADAGHTTVSRPLAPTPEWCDAFLSAVATRLHAFDEHSLSTVLISLARLDIRPSGDWATSVIGHLTWGLSNVGPQALANSMWALAKLGFTLNEEGAGALMALLRCHLPPLASDAAGSSKSHDTEQSTVGSDSTAGSRSAYLTPQELSNVLYALARFRYRPDDSALEQLLACAAHQYSAALTSPATNTASPTLSPVPVQAQELANTLWALSQLGVQPSEGWLYLYWATLERRLSTFNGKDLAQVVYCLAKMGVTPPKPPAAMASNMVSAALAGPFLTYDEYGHSVVASSSINNVLPTTGAEQGQQQGVQDGLQHPPEGTTRSGKVPLWAHKLLAEAALTIPRSNGQDLANLAWGLAQLGVQPGQEWCSRLAGSLTSRCEAFSAGHITVALWGLARMGYKPQPTSLLPIEGTLYRRMNTLAPRELAAAVWAFATMSYMPDVAWLEAFAARCLELAAVFTQRDWSVVVYSLASIVDANKDMGVFLEDLFFSPQLDAQLSKFNPSSLALLIYSAGLLGASSQGMAARLLTASIPHMEAFTDKELSALMTACVNLGRPPPRAFLVAWMHELRRRMEAMEAAAVATDGTNTPVTAPAVAAAKRPVGFGGRQTSGSTSRARSPSVAPEQGAQDNTGLVSPLAHVSAPVLAAPEQVQTEPEVDGMLSEGQQGPGHQHQGSEEPQEQGSLQGLGQPATLSGSVLAVCGWALAKLSLKPKPQWLELYQRAVIRCMAPALAQPGGQQGGITPLSPLEFTLAAWALGTWEAELDRASFAELAGMAEHYKPQYDRRTRTTLRGVLTVLKQRTLHHTPQQPQQRVPADQ